MPPEEESSIERLKRNLYSRNKNLVPKEKRTPVQGHESNVRTDWGDNISFDLPEQTAMVHNNSFFNKFLLGSLAFFLLALFVAVFIFFGGANLISSNNLDIKITAPSSISSGEEFDMGVSVINLNRTDLEEVALFVNYPEGAKSVSGENKALSYEKINLGTVAKGAMSDNTIRSLLFGEKDAIKTFSLRLEYKVKGSNAVFSKEKTYDVVIGSSPLLLNVIYPKEVNSGQRVTFSIELTSNSSALVRGSLVKVLYPYGFTYKDSSMKPLRDNSIWSMGDLKSGDKKILTISGVLVGQNLEDRTFNFSSGTPSPGNLSDFDTTLVATAATIGIRKSFYNLSVTPEGEAPLPGSPVRVKIKWENTLSDKILNNHVEAILSGNAFNRSEVSTGVEGFYRSSDNTIVWDKNNTAGLASFSPGDSSEVSFAVSSFQNNAQTRLVKNPHIDLHVAIAGDRSGLDPGEVSSDADITIKILTTLGLSAKSFRDIGPFSNTGPVPPRADKESTYTITWTLTNTTNDLKDALVTAVLPAGVMWKGEVSPSGEGITYNPDARTVSWSAGSVSSGTGFTYSPKEVSFKVGLTPSINQISTSPVLILETNVTATDTYVEVPISAHAERVTTHFSDPSFSGLKDTVVK